MKPTLIFLAVLLACSAGFFLARHHHRNPNTFKDCTLAEIYAGLFREVPMTLSTKMAGFYSFALLGITAAFFPAALVLMTRGLTSNPATGNGVFFIVGGLLALAGTGANVFAMIFSHLNFGWGVSTSKGEETPFFFILPIVQIVFALMSLAIGCSSTCAAWAHRLVFV